MTEKTVKAAKAAAAETTATVESTLAKTVESVKETIANVQAKLEVPAAARDYVVKAAATVKERAEDAHTGANELTASMEKGLVKLVGASTNVTRGLIDATFANIQHALVTVEKVATAKSVNEAMQIQADYVRESARANYDRVRDAAEVARTAIVDGAKTMQAEVTKLMPAKKAA